MTPADRPRAVALVCAAALLAPIPAAAQSAAAEVLFRDGRALLKAGKTAQGCDKLEASERLESSVGTLLNLGDCREKLGEFATAWAAFRKAEAMAKRAGKDDKRELEARKRATALEPKLTYLVLELDARIPGIVVRGDGELIPSALWNTGVPVDPGTYELVVEAPGFTPWRTTVPIDPKLKRRVVTVPGLTPAPTLSEPDLRPRLAAPPLPGPVTDPQPALVVTSRRDRSIWTPTRKVSAGLAVVGVGAIGLGAYFGFRARDLEDQANRKCPLVTCGDLEALRQNDRARTAATRANVLYTAGGITAGAAALLWFVGAPKESRMWPTAGKGGLGVTLRGKF